MGVVLDVPGFSVKIAAEQRGDRRAVGGCTYKVDSADHLLRTVISMGSQLATKAHVLKHSYIK